MYSQMNFVSHYVVVFLPSVLYFLFLLITAFIKSDLRRQKANQQAEVQTVSVSTAVICQVKGGIFTSP